MAYYFSLELGVSFTSISFDISRHDRCVNNESAVVHEAMINYGGFRVLCICLINDYTSYSQIIFYCNFFHCSLFHHSLNLATLIICTFGNYQL